MEGVNRPNFQQPFTGTGLLVDGQGHKCKTLLGWMVAENAGTPGVARVLFRDGAAGTILMDIHLSATESAGESLHIMNCYRFESGLYVEVVTGTVRGSIRGRT